MNNFEDKGNDSKSINLQSFTLVFLCFYCFSQLLIGNKIQNAWRDLLSGDAQGYSQQVHARISLMERSKGKHLQIAPIKSVPYSIFVGDIQNDSLHWTNKAMAEYFELGSIQIDSTLTYK